MSKKIFQSIKSTAAIRHLWLLSRMRRITESKYIAALKISLRRSGVEVKDNVITRKSNSNPTAVDTKMIGALKTTIMEKAMQN